LIFCSAGHHTGCHASSSQWAALFSQDQDTAYTVLPDKFLAVSDAGLSVNQTWYPAGIYTPAIFSDHP
jgi:hypothetical protein